MSKKFLINFKIYKLIKEEPIEKQAEINLFNFQDYGRETNNYLNKFHFQIKM